MATDKPDLIIWDRESPQKCSIYPLRHRQGLHFVHSDRIVAREIAEDSWSGYLFLHVDGPPLTQDDCNLPLLLLDASWKRAEKLGVQAVLQNLPKRSLHGFTTAYPRVSKLYQMPSIGLASVEALYIAYLIQGREDPALLEHYHWQGEFLHYNQAVIDEWRQIWQSKIRVPD